MARKKKRKEEAQVLEQANGTAPYVYQSTIPGNCPFPSAPASSMVQMPPIVQPIVMVPVNGQQPPTPFANPGMMGMGMGAQPGLLELLGSMYADDDDDEFDI